MVLAFYKIGHYFGVGHSSVFKPITCLKSNLRTEIRTPNGFEVHGSCWHLGVRNLFPSTAFDSFSVNEIHIIIPYFKKKSFLDFNFVQRQKR